MSRSAKRVSASSWVSSMCSRVSRPGLGERRRPRPDDYSRVRPRPALLRRRRRYRVVEARGRGRGRRVRFSEGTASSIPAARRSTLLRGPSRGCSRASRTDPSDERGVDGGFRGLNSIRRLLANIRARFVARRVRVSVRKEIAVYPIDWRLHSRDVNASGLYAVLARNPPAREVTLSPPR